jgi:hypothetical protein
MLRTGIRILPIIFPSPPVEREPQSAQSFTAYALPPCQGPVLRGNAKNAENIPEIPQKSLTHARNQLEHERSTGNTWGDDAGTAVLSRPGVPPKPDWKSQLRKSEA